MSKPRLQLNAIVDTAAHADTIIVQIRTQLSGKDIFEEHNLSKFIEENGTINLSFDFRFNSLVDRDDIKAWLKNQVQNHPQVKTWVQSVTVIDHLCSHDDSSILDCNTTEYLEWIRG